MKNLKKMACILTCLVLLTGLFAGCEKQNSKDAYVIGVSAPLTGSSSTYGIAVKNGAEMAIEEINNAGGLNGVDFVLISTDDMNDATKVATNYASLYEKGMQISLGCVTSLPGIEFTNLSKDDNLFFITPSASNDDIPQYDNGYQMCFADGNQGKVAAEYVNEAYQGKTIGIFYKADDNYSQGIYTQFKANLDPSVTTIDTSFTDANASDFTTQLESLKNCEFIFMPIYYQPASLFMKQGKSIISASAVYYGCDGFDGINSVKGFDLDAIPQEVSMLSHFNSKASDGSAKEFIDKYVEKYGTETLNQFAASAYDCIYAIYGAMKQAEINDVSISASDLCEKMKTVFQGGYTFSGVTGNNITWDENGYVNKSAVKYIIKEAK